MCITSLLVGGCDRSFQLIIVASQRTMTYCGHFQISVLLLLSAHLWISLFVWGL